MGDANEHDDGSIEEHEIEVGDDVEEIEETTVESSRSSGGASASGTVSTDADDAEGGGKMDAKKMLTKAVTETVKAGAKLEVRAWKGGFLGWLGRGIGTTCSRTWVVDHPEYTGTITLEHDCLTGRRVLYIDRVVVYQRTVFPDKSFEIWFDIDGRSGRVCAENDFKGNALYYSCMYADEALVTTLAERDNESTKFRPSIPDTVVEVDGKLEVAYYNVHVQCDEGDFVLKKRFSEFVDLYEKIWASYSSDELLQQVPKPPKKQFKLFTKHHDASFVENRRTALQAFMQGLCKVPAIERNLYLLEFMGKEPPAKRGEGIVTMLDTCESKFKFTVNASGATLFKKLADWEDVSWKGADACEVTVSTCVCVCVAHAGVFCGSPSKYLTFPILDMQNTEEGKMRRFKIPEPWGDVVEVRI